MYVISGELEFEVGGVDGLRFTVTAGSFVRKPAGMLAANKLTSVATMNMPWEGKAVPSPRKR